MGMDLSGKGGYFRWGGRPWSAMLMLALDNGWEPMGTGAPRGMLIADWKGGYSSNDGQRVYVRDARHLADALERGLASLPPEDPEGEWLLSAAGRDALREFIVFCRAGTFRIH